MPVALGSDPISAELLAALLWVQTHFNETRIQTWWGNVSYPSPLPPEKS